VPEHRKSYMAVVDQEHGTKWAAWCSHCSLESPMGLELAIEHRFEQHADCLSCYAEALLYLAIINGGQVLVAPNLPF